VLAGDKPGDNAQCLALAARLGWETEAKQLAYRSLGRSPWRPFGEARFVLDPTKSSPLEPPWPDLVIGCGRRSVPVAWEIRSRSGGTVRLVQFGRPRADLDGFDLVVSSAQYLLPEHPKVLHLVLPLQAFDPNVRARAAAEWAPRFEGLPRPRIALLVGGTAVPFVLDVPAARRLAEQVNALVRAEGGSVLISTSRRTPEASARAICEGVEAPVYVHRWTPAAEPNPYPAYLALADAFVVTGDSASMLADACSTGRPVWIADLPTHRSLRSHLKNLVRRGLGGRSGPGHGNAGRLARLRSAALARGWIRYSRDLHALHEALVAAGRAMPLGRRFDAPPPPPGNEVELVAARVRALFQAFPGISSKGSSRDAHR